MVYQHRNQLKSYHHIPDRFLSTSQHFFDNTRVESPDPDRRSEAHKVGVCEREREVVVWLWMWE